MKASHRKSLGEVTRKVSDKRFPLLTVLPANKANRSQYDEEDGKINNKSEPGRSTENQKKCKPLLEMVMHPKHWVIIDIGGERFQAQRSIFLGYPSTRLGKLMHASSVQEILKYCEEFVPGNPPEYFFDRNPETFPGILDMYRTGTFHVPEGGRSCAFVMRRDFTYWGLDELDMEACCALKYYPEIEVCRLQTEGDEEQKIKEEKEAADADFGEGALARVRTWVWETFEKPWTSSFAKHYACFSLLMVVISTVTFVISTSVSEEVQVPNMTQA